MNVESLLEFQCLSRQIKYSRKPDEIARTLFDVIRELIPVNKIGLYVLSSGSEILIPVGEESKLLQPYAKMLGEEGVVNWVLDDDESKLVPTIPSDICSRLEESELYVVPLRVFDQQIGVLIFKLSENEPYLEKYDETLITLLADQVALALRHSYDYQEAKVAERKLSKLVNSIDSVIFTTDESGTIDFINYQVRLFGYEPSNLIGHSIHHLIPFDKDKGRLYKVIQDNKSFIYETDLAISRNRKKHFRITIVPFNDNISTSAGCFGIIKEISDQKSDNSAKWKNVRKTALAEASVCINHEINNPLSVIQGNLYLLEKSLPLNRYPFAKRNISTIKQNTERIVDTIKKFDSLTSKESVPYHGKVKMIDLSSEMESESVSLDSTFKKPVQFSKD